jgi:hypothetical protein
MDENEQKSICQPLSRRDLLALSACSGIAYLLGPAATHSHGATPNPSFNGREPYIDYDRELAPLMPFRPQSFYLQPWRGYLETVPAAQMLAGIGVAYNLPHDVDHAVAIGRLADFGFRNIRLEISWTDVPWEEDRLNSHAVFESILTACRDNNVTPVILLNANDGAPCPHRNYSRTVISDTAPGATELVLDDVMELLPGQSGLSYLFHAPMAGFLFTQIDSSTGTVTLSRPLPGNIAAGTRVTVSTLKYPPLYAVGTPEFESTAAAWLRYVGLVCGLLEECNLPAVEVEVWNEMSFGSAFTRINNYYDPPLAPLTPDFLHAGGCCWELARRTHDVVKQLLPKAKLIWGFSNTSFYHTKIKDLPSGFDAQSYHPYGAGKKVTPTDFPEKDRYGWFIEGYVPMGLTRCMPEGWAHLGVKMEHLPRLLNPKSRLAAGPPGVDQFQHYFTEHGFPPREAGITDAASGDQYKALCLLRSLLFWLNKGLTKILFYCAYEDDDLGFGMLRAVPTPADYGRVAESDISSPALEALRRMVAKFSGAEKILAPATLGVELTCLDKPAVVFAGDGLHPALLYSDMVAVLPFQVSASKFVIAVYVMCYDVTAPPPPMAVQLSLAHLPRGVKDVSYYDPLSDERLKSSYDQGADGLLNVCLSASHSARLLTIITR